MQIEFILHKKTYVRKNIVGNEAKVYLPYSITYMINEEHVECARIELRKKDRVL